MEVLLRKLNCRMEWTDEKLKNERYIPASAACSALSNPLSTVKR